MTDDERATAALVARLRGEIREDRALLARCIADADQAGTRIATAPDDPAILALGAVGVHGWYTGLETILERIARQIDQEVPTGPRWHRELLSQMVVEIPGVRPPVLPSPTLPMLAELLTFRHFFRHAYGIVLDHDRIVLHLANLASVAPPTDVALDAFDAFLARAG